MWMMHAGSEVTILWIHICPSGYTRESAWFDIEQVEKKGLRALPLLYCNWLLPFSSSLLQQQTDYASSVNQQIADTMYCLLPQLVIFVKHTNSIAGIYLFNLYAARLIIKRDSFKDLLSFPKKTPFNFLHSTPPFIFIYY